MPHSFGALAAMLVASSLWACSTGSSTPMIPPSSTQDARKIVMNFYREALLEKHPRAAFSRYMANSFIEHKPDVELGTRESAAKFLEDLMTSLPAARWEVVRTVSEGQFVVVHAKFTPVPGAAPYAIADFFKVDQGFIVEHWDVVAGPSRTNLNSHSRF